MRALVLGDVARRAGATLPAGADPQLLVTSVVSDSRQVTAGSLFVALQGASQDGHDFLPEVAQRGAVAALVARPDPALPCLVAPDPLAALQRLAVAVFTEGGAPYTLGITGSSGKTSTKDLMWQVLQPDGPLLYPRNSLNTEVGLPLTLVRREPDMRCAVLEYSARGKGHIAFLCGLAAPDCALVLNVGSAHLGEFGSRAAIAEAKGELVEAARAEVVLCADDPLVLAMAERRGAGTSLHTYGLGPDAEVRGTGIALDGSARPSFRLHTPEGSAPVRLRLFGQHQVRNAVATAAAVRAAGLVTEPAELAERLSAAEPVSRWRMEVHRRPDGVTVVNDAYNANPESVRAALEMLASLQVTGRRVAVLGPMAELGPAEAEAHAEVGRLTGRLGVDELVTVGAAADGIAAASAGVGALHQVSDQEQARKLLAELIQPGDAVLVKASRAVGLDQLGDWLAGAAG